MRSASRGSTEVGKDMSFVEGGIFDGVVMSVGMSGGGFDP